MGSLCIVRCSLSRKSLREDFGIFKAVFQFMWSLSVRIEM